MVTPCWLLLCICVLRLEAQPSNKLVTIIYDVLFGILCSSTFKTANILTVVPQKVEGQAVQSNWYDAGPPCASTARTEGRTLQTLRRVSACTPQILLTEVGTYTETSITNLITSHTVFHMHYRSLSTNLRSCSWSTAYLSVTPARRRRGEWPAVRPLM